MAAEVIVFPDAVATVVGHLRTRLAAAGFTTTVGTEVPSVLPDSFVLVRRVGGQRSNLTTDDALVIVESWNTVAENAHDLAQYARGLLLAMPRDAISGVRRVDEAGGPQFFPDPLTDHPRYVFTHQIAMRGTAA